MKYTSSVLVSLAVAASSYALSTPRADSTQPCPGAKTVHTDSIAVGAKTVEMTTFSCDLPQAFAAFPADTPPTADVCAELCQDVCANNGSLPPTTEDCATIMDAITLFNGSHSPSFVIQSGHVQTLSFGTCRFFFENFAPNAVTYCWLSLGQVASAAASACLPPVQPVNTEGLCIANTGLWRVGVAHA